MVWLDLAQMIEYETERERESPNAGTFQSLGRDGSKVGLNKVCFVSLLQAIEGTLLDTSSLTNPFTTPISRFLTVATRLDPHGTVKRNRRLVG
jgi:hypothetical protein